MYGIFILFLEFLFICMSAFAVVHSIVQIVYDLKAKAMLRKAIAETEDPDLAALKTKAMTEKLDRVEMETLRARIEAVAQTLPAEVAKRVRNGTTQNRRDAERNYIMDVMFG